ncbi:protein adenylyltransferase SelO [Demetria terragena]|uniref:protein adenylyltransferase SelO n=1 Tax=Demetria terragena TaxID=63959 RepID=UPI0003751093|nr:YdiU family protein [Demetria terragena]
MAQHPGVGPASSAWSHRFAEELPELVTPWQADVPTEPRPVTLNHELASEVGIAPSTLQDPEGLRDLLRGDGSAVAMAYAGHQFGNYSPLLGDGRALLLGEATDKRLDIHLKGSGATPFARAGDGKAALGPMLREYVVAEAMHALGLPTTRSLAVISTGDTVRREGAKPGAILVRVAASHLRVGTFELAARASDPDVLQRLADHAISRHYPEVADSDNPYLGLLDAVVAAQADLIAQWMSVGFIHGVMNTDNMTISGQTIDYGPCAFLDEFTPGAVFSSIDHGGRYAYANQPGVGLWNLSRFAETVLRLLSSDPDEGVALATASVTKYEAIYQAAWRARMLAKLGLPDTTADSTLVEQLLELLDRHGADYTSTFGELATWLERPSAHTESALWTAPEWTAWLDRWRDAMNVAGLEGPTVASRMRQVNPTRIPRNHLLEEALDAAETGDLEPVHELIDAVTDPYGMRPHPERYAAAPPPGFTASHQTFCGT